jgi:hypothetical protein
MCNAAETVTKAGYLLSTKKDVLARARQTEFFFFNHNQLVYGSTAPKTGQLGAETKFGRTEQRKFLKSTKSE